MAFLESGYLAEDVEFKKRVMIALLTAAKDIMAEVNTTTAHSQRVTYASKVIANPVDEAANATNLIVTNTSIVASFNKNITRYTTTATDSDIQFTVNSLFNALAGVST